jgi:uncharacterized protein
MEMNRIVQSILSEYRLNLRGTHGAWHWLRVRSNGLALAEATPAADREVVELFALLHDSQRFDEYEDIEHGKRAAEFVERLSAEGVITLGQARLKTLMKACAGHTIEVRSTDPTIGCCYDADRLDLSRLGDAPDDRFMSTVASADPELRRLAWGRGYHRIEDVDAARALGFTL